MQWLAFVPKEFKLSGLGSYGREAGGVMLSVTGLNHFIMSVILPICVVNTAVCCLSFVNGFIVNSMMETSL